MEQIFAIALTAVLSIATAALAAETLNGAGAAFFALTIAGRVIRWRYKR